MGYRYVRAKSRKGLEENTGEKNSDFDLGKEFLGHKKPESFKELYIKFHQIVNILLFEYH